MEKIECEVKLGPVDGAILVDPHKSLSDRRAHLGVNGEAVPVPGNTTPQGPQLVVDGVTTKGLTLA